MNSTKKNNTKLRKENVFEHSYFNYKLIKVKPPLQYFL